MEKRDIRKSIAIGVSLLLAACAAAGDSGGRKAIEADFVCGADVVHTRFVSAGMTLELGANEYVLTQARSGSGARYTGDSPDGPVEFWNKGRDARLTIGGRTFPECHQQGETR